MLFRNQNTNNIFPVQFSLTPVTAKDNLKKTGLIRTIKNRAAAMGNKHGLCRKNVFYTEESVILAMITQKNSTCLKRYYTLSAN